MATEILTWKEKDTWIAAWRRYDVVAMGQSEEQATNRLLQAIAWQAIMDAESNNVPFANIAIHPDVVAEWDTLHLRAHPFKLKLIKRQNEE
jgi:hypothetical protein